LIAAKPPAPGGALVPTTAAAACRPCDVPPIGHVGAVWEDDGSSDGEESSWTLRDLSSVGGFTLTVHDGEKPEPESDSDDALAAQGIYLHSDTSSEAADTEPESVAEPKPEPEAELPFTAERMYVA